MPFQHLRLICPRCRQLDAENNLARHPLKVDSWAGREARLNHLEGVSALVCSNRHCNSRYPVIAGIPVILPTPDAISLATSPPFDLLSTPIPTLNALLEGRDPRSPLAELMSRLARYAWAGFSDCLETEDPRAGLAEPHAKQLMHWLEPDRDSAGEGEVSSIRGEVAASRADASTLGAKASARTEDSPAEARLQTVLGSALGREAFETRYGPMLLAEAHLPSLLAALRLQREGSCELLQPVDCAWWEPIRYRVPSPPRVPVANICCDVLDPPFEAEEFSKVLAPNLIDSVHNPLMAIGQAHAMTRPGGELVLTSPFSWRENVTPRERWLELVSKTGLHTAEEMIASIASFSLVPPMRVVDRKEINWTLRSSAREMVLYRSLALRLRHQSEGEPSSHSAD